jgi:hypothetical protein
VDKGMDYKSKHYINVITLNILGCTGEIRMVRRRTTQKKGDFKSL